MRIQSLDILRAISVILILIVHSISRYQRTFDLTLDTSVVFNFPNFYSLFYIGVDIFFCLSGLLIYLMYSNKFQKKLSLNFLKSRLLRILPVYWFLTLLAFLLLSISPSVFTYHNNNYNFYWVIGNIFLIPLGIYNEFSFYPILGAAWTLRYEIFFYVIFSFALLFKKPFGLIILFTIPLFLVILGIFFKFNTSFGMYTNPIIIEFLFGIFIGIYIDNLKKISLTVSLLFFIIIFSLLLSSSFLDIVTNFNRLIYWGIPSALIIILFIRFNNIINKFSPRILFKISTYSYSIYLLQIFLLPFFSNILKFFKINNYINPDLIIICLVLLTLFTGSFFSKIFEFKILKFNIK